MAVIYRNGVAYGGPQKWSDIKNKPTTLEGFGITDAVEKESGKGLSTNDFTDSYKDQLDELANGNVNIDISGKADTSYVDTELAKKVDKVTGKQLSTEDFTTEEKTKLASLENVDISGKVDKVSGKGLSTNDYTNADKAIVDGVTSALSGKVDKVSGKQLSTEDFTTEEKTKLAGLQNIDISGKADISYVDTELNKKVGKITGKGLSSNDYTDEDKLVVSGVTSGLKSKVDKIFGKGLSTEDFTTEEKTKLASLENVDISGKVDKVLGKGLSTEDYTTEEKTKLAGIEAGAQVNPVTYDASLISGVIDISHLPATVIERMKTVANDAAMLALTTADVQNGDVVRVAYTGRMYMVVDDTKLNNMDGYSEFSAGRAGAVDWSGVESKPTTLSGYGITDAYTKTEADSALAGKVDAVSGKGLSTEDFTTEEKTKLASLENVDISGKVDKVSGKGLSTNDYTNADKAIVDGVTSALSGKVDKVSGKQLSTEDYTTAEKTKLASLENVDISGKVDKVVGKQLSTEDYTTAEKTKLSGLDNAIELTSAQYDALSTAEKNNGTVYYITDINAEMGVIYKNGVPYGGSGDLSSIQRQINALEARIAALESNGQQTSVSATVDQNGILNTVGTVDSNGVLNVSATVDQNGVLTY